MKIKKPCEYCGRAEIVKHGMCQRHNDIRNRLNAVAALAFTAPEGSKN